MSIRIIHILGSIGHDFGGPAYSVPSLAAALQYKDIDTEIVSISAGKRNEIIESNQISSKIFPARVGGMFQLSFGLFKYLISQKERDVVFHIHTFWNMIGLVTLFALLINKRPHLIISMRGVLLPAARCKKRFRKFIAWHLFVKYLIRKADAVHVTSKEERDEFLKIIDNSKVYLIHNIPPTSKISNIGEVASTQNIFNSFANRYRYFGTMSRIVPHKGVHKIIKAFTLLSNMYDDWRLLIAGPIEDVKYHNELLSMVKANNLADKVIFVGQLNGKNKEEFFEKIELFILLSDSENYGMSIVESLHHSTPVIATKNSPWSEIAKYSAGWWIDDDEKVILSTMRESLSTETSELKNMGENGVKIISLIEQDAPNVKYIEMYKEVVHV